MTEYEIFHDYNVTNLIPIIPACPENCDLCNDDGECQTCSEGFILLSTDNQTYSCVENPCTAGQQYNYNT